MKIGLNTGAVDTAVRDAREAEDLGFDYVGCGEHLFFHGPTANAFVQLAAAAGATAHVRLVSTITLLPLYPAALAAKQAATLDRICGGRFELGVGSGGEYPAEFEASGVDTAERFRRTDEALEVMRRLFTGDRVSFDGEFTRLSDVALDPPPLQQPGPPVWLGGRKRGAMRRAGRFADVWMPYMMDPPKFRNSLEQVRAAAAEHGRGPGAVAGALFVWTCIDPDGDWARRTGIETVSNTYAQDFTPLADRYLLLGTPDDAARRLAEFADAGADRVLIQVAAPPADRQRVVDTVAAELLPRVARS
ncbi:MAG: LLM class flavin-dependent oxidoreductase [Pseudonocardiaceae bacterium]|nr:LLM class flavin-dependent oxidoreductase [Pseudonocardiaceae bacterium]